METCIETSGYGFSRKLCESVSSWFLNEFLFDEFIYLQIHHRGLNREKIYGSCDFLKSHRKPRHFLIEVSTYLNKELYIKTLLHELVHLRQWVRGDLELKRGKLYYQKSVIQTKDYWSQPHEIEAHEQENVLYEQYLSFKNT